MTTCLTQHTRRCLETGIGSIHAADELENLICQTGTVTDAFTTIQGDSGTSPTADSSTDTLTLTGTGGITVIGDATTDTMTIDGSGIVQTLAQVLATGNTTGGTDIIISDTDLITGSGGQVKLDLNSDSYLSVYTAATERTKFNADGTLTHWSSARFGSAAETGTAYLTDSVNYTITTSGGSCGFSAGVQDGTRNSRFRLRLLDVVGGPSLLQIATTAISGAVDTTFTYQGSERMRLTSTGNLGIGVSPTQKLQVLGSWGLVAGSSFTEGVSKSGRFGMPHYNNTTNTEPVTIFYSESDGTVNKVLLGGGTSAGLAATVIQFMTAANDTTLVGSTRMTIDSAGLVGIGTGSPSGLLDLGGSRSFAGWSSSATGRAFIVSAQTLTDTDQTGTIASRVVNSIGTPTLAASNAVVLTDAANFYVSSAPTAGTNTTITNPWAVWIDAGNTRHDGSISLGLATTPQAKLHIDSGDATNSAIKFTAGTTTGTGASNGFEVGIDTTGIGELRNKNNQAIYIYTNDTERTRFNANGTLTHFSSARFGSAATTGSSYVTNSVNYTSVTASDVIGFSGNITDGTRNPRFRLQLTDVVGGPGILDLGTTSSSGFVDTTFSYGGSELMRMTAAGNFGIGVTPTQKLSVLGTWALYGAQSFTALVSKNSRIGFPHYDNTTYTSPVTTLYAESTATENLVIFGGGTSAGYAATSIRFHTAANQQTTVGTSRMAINTDGLIHMGGASFVSLLNLGGSRSFAGWASSGTGRAFSVQNHTITDTDQTGTIGARTASSFGTTTFASTNSVTVTHAATLYLASAPTAGTNTTITNPYALWVDAGDVRLDASLSVGTGALPTSRFILGGSTSWAGWANSGTGRNFATLNATLTDTDQTGTISLRVAHSFAALTFASTNAVTVTSAATLYLAGSPVAGSNTTITSGYALLVDAGQCRFDDSISVGTSGAPLARLYVGGGFSQADWTSSATGRNLAILASTLTDTNQTGTIGLRVANSFSTTTFASTNAVTVTTAATVHIASAPTAGTNTTLTASHALYVATGNVYFNDTLQVGLTGSSATGRISVYQATSVANWISSSAGRVISSVSGTLTDTTESGTIALRVAHSYGAPTFASTNAVTVTNAASIYLSGAVTAGTNTTITNSWVIYCDAGDIRQDGNLAIGGGIITTPQSVIHVDAGNATASQLRLTAGTTTGQTTTDGFVFGITSAGVGEIRQYENQDIIFYTNNVETLRLVAAGGLTTTKSVTVTDADFILGTTTGSKIGTATSQKLSLWNATPNIQPTTAITAGAFVANTSGIVDDSATFDGYTMGQVVAALRRIGALA